MDHDEFKILNTPYFSVPHSIHFDSSIKLVLYDITQFYFSRIFYLFKHILCTDVIMAKKVRNPCWWHRINFSIKFIPDVGFAFIIYFFGLCFFVVLKIIFIFNSNLDEWPKNILFYSLSQLTFEKVKSCILLSLKVIL